jgi:hypothetical protein
MTAAVPKCSHCADTGSLSKELEGQLDCVYCKATDERMALEAWCRANIPQFSSPSTVAWLIYQHGYGAGFTESQLFG